MRKSRALFAQIEAEQGRLDMLVNNAAYLHPQLIEPKPFWEKDLAGCEILNVGLRSAYVASWHAAKLMVAQGSGLIAFGSSFGGSLLHARPRLRRAEGGDRQAGARHGARSARHRRCRRLDLDGSADYRTSLIARQQHPEQYEGFLDNAENPEFTAHILDAIDKAPDRDELSGQTLIGAEIAKALGVTDRGNERPSYRDMLGSPRPKNPAAVY